MLRVLISLATRIAGLRTTHPESRLRREAELNDRAVERVNAISERIERADAATDEMIADIRREHRLKVALSVLERRLL